jgi:hypothetical protein
MRSIGKVLTDILYFVLFVALFWIAAVIAYVAVYAGTCLISRSCLSDAGQLPEEVIAAVVAGPLAVGLSVLVIDSLIKRYPRRLFSLGFVSLAALFGIYTWPNRGTWSPDELREFICFDVTLLAASIVGAALLWWPRDEQGRKQPF